MYSGYGVYAGVYAVCVLHTSMQDVLVAQCTWYVHWVYTKYGRDVYLLCTLLLEVLGVSF